MRSFHAIPLVLKAFPCARSLRRTAPCIRRNRTETCFLHWNIGANIRNRSGFIHHLVYACAQNNMKYIKFRHQHWFIANTWGQVLLRRRVLTRSVNAPMSSNQLSMRHYQSKNSAIETAETACNGGVQWTLQRPRCEYLGWTSGLK